MNLEHIKLYGPTNFEEAQAVRAQFIWFSQAALTAERANEIYIALESVRCWGNLLPLARLFFNEEARRLELTAETAIVASMSNQ